MTEDNNRSDLGSETAGNSPDTSASVPPKRIEDLLMDDAEAPGSTFRDIADQEVQSGAGVDSSLRWPLVILAVLIVAIVAVVIGWYQFGDLMSGQPVAGGMSGVEKRMAMPERSQFLQEFKEDTQEKITSTEVAAQDGAQQKKEVAAENIREVDSDEPLAMTEESLSAAAEPAVSVEEEVVEIILIPAEGTVSEEPQAVAESPPVEVTEPVYRVLVGPFISQRALERAEELLRQRGFQPERQRGSGTVDMIRLLEGIYPLALAQQRLEELRNEFASAFLLPDGDRWALYIGSFSDRDRARRQQRDLAERQIEVVQVDSQLTMEGPLLVVVRSGLNAAEEVATDINTSGLRARIEVER